MKKIILATAILLTTVTLSAVTKNNTIKAVKVAKAAVIIDNTVLATAD